MINLFRCSNSGVSKIHYILIFAITCLVGLSVWLLNSDFKFNTAKDSNTSVKVSATTVSKKVKKPNTADYIQGPQVVPDLEAGFKRCLNRGYTDLQKEVLSDARNAFINKDFDEGKFSWSRVQLYDEMDNLFLYHLNDKMVLDISKKEDKLFVKTETVKKSSLDDLKQRLAGKKIVLNLYAQTFRKDALNMDLVLENGLMKSLIIRSPKKRVVCKP